MPPKEKKKELVFLFSHTSLSLSSRPIQPPYYMASLSCFTLQRPKPNPPVLLLYHLGASLPHATIDSTGLLKDSNFSLHPPKSSTTTTT